MTYAKPYNPTSLRPNKVIIAGTFVTAAAGLEPTKLSGVGFTVVRGGVGIYIVLFDDNIVSFDSILLSTDDPVIFSYAKLKGKSDQSLAIETWTETASNMTIADFDSTTVSFLAYVTI